MTIPTWATVFTDNVSVIPASFLNDYVRTQIPKALDGTGGGSYSPSAVLDIGGTAGLRLTGSGAAERLRYASHSLSRTSSEVMYDSSGAFASQAALVVSAGATGTQFIRPPNACTLTGFTVYINRTNTGTLPGTRVSVTLRKRASSTGTQSIVSGPTIDPESVLANYEAHHAITISGLSETIDNTDYVYWVELSGEVAPNATTVALYPVIYTFSVTSQDEAP